MASFIPAFWLSLRRRPRRPAPRPGGRRLPLFECLETRQLLSASLAGALVPRGIGAAHYLVNVQTATQPVLQVSTDNGATFTSYTAPAGWDPSAGVALAGGSGTFRAAPNHPGTVPDSLLAASTDFNGDGRPDLALVLDNRVSLLLSQPDGSYQTALTVSPTPGGQVLFLAAGDFNGDGRTDLATVSRTPGQDGLSLDVLLGQGAGSFRTRVDLATGPQVFAVTVGTYDSNASLMLGNLTGDDAQELLLTRRDPGASGPRAFEFFATPDGTFQESAPPDPAPTSQSTVSPATDPDVNTPVAGVVFGPLPPSGPAAVPDQTAPAAVPDSAGTTPVAGSVSPGSAADQYVAVGAASGDVVLPVQVLVMPETGSDLSDPSEAGVPVTGDDAEAAVNLVVRVDAAGDGTFEARPISLTAFHGEAGTDRVSTPALAGGDSTPLAAGPVSPALSPSSAAGPLGAKGLHENDPDPGNPRPVSASESTSVTASEAADALVLPGFAPLTVLGDRGESLPGPDMAEGLILTAVTEVNSEGRPAAPAGEEEPSEVVNPGRTTAPDPGSLADTPGLAVLRLDPATDAAFWSRLDLGLSLSGADAGLARARPGDRPPAAEDAPDFRSSLLKVGTFLAQAFYLHKLQPAAAAAGGAGQAAADPRFQVAEVVKEAAVEVTRLVRGFYERFLGRAALNGEEQGWVSMLLGGQTEEQVLSAVLSTEEFGRRASALIASVTPDEAFIQALYALVLLRAATDEELTSWLTALPTLSRRGVAYSVLRSVEYRKAQVEAYYRELSQREGDADEVAAWAATPFDLRKIRELLMSRPELFAGP
jgi:hypothetical protein